MGLFSIIRSMFKSSTVSNSPSNDDSSSFSPPDDYGINPSTGLPMISGAIDAGGYMFGEQSTTVDSSSSSSSMFDDSSASSSSFDDSSSCASPFASEIGSSYSCGMSDSFDSSSSSFDSCGSSSSGSMFDD